MASPRRMLAALIILLLGGVLLAGCGDEMISQDEMTENIKKQYREQTGVDLTSLECEDVKAEKGAAISCDGTNSSDVNLKITGKVKGEDEDSDKWRFSWVVSERNAPGALFADPAAEAIESKFGVTVGSVECPERIKVVKGTEVPCKATYDDGSSNDIIIKLTNEEGGFRVMIDK